MPTIFSPCFSFQISMCILNEKAFVLLISQPVKGKTAHYILLLLEFSVLLFPSKAAIVRKPWFTGTIEHRSLDQSERA